MQNLLKKLGFSNSKKEIRVTRNIRAEKLARQITSTQIAKMGQFGQQLVVMSKWNKFRSRYLKIKRARFVFVFFVKGFKQEKSNTTVA